MKVRDLLKMEICVDVVDDVTEELYIAFDGPQELTRIGKMKFALALDLEVEPSRDPGLWIVKVDDDDERIWKRRLNNARDLFEGMAGFCTVDEYELWFTEPDDEDDTSTADDDTEPVKDVANLLLRERFPSYWGTFDADFYNAVVENVKEASNWPNWNDDDVSLAVQRIIIWNMKKGVTEG